MKIIVSHDVDHLYRSDHFRDLIYPKLWIRSTLELAKKEIGVREWYHRMGSPFNSVRNRIDEVLSFDKRYNVESSFFFGMAKGLGMNYDAKKTPDIIKKVEKKGFHAGVHGIAYNDYGGMVKEYDEFCKLNNHTPNGIRMHYVRFDNSTFQLLSKVGYKFDSSEFDKENGYLIKNPYKIGNMWEFPLVMMDGYLPPRLDDMKKKSLEIIEEAEKEGLEYLTLLFHDYLFSDGYNTNREWYKWIISWLAENDYEFVSYNEAINELEGKSFE